MARRVKLHLEVMNRLEIRTKRTNRRRTFKRLNDALDNLASDSLTGQTISTDCDLYSSAR